MKNFNVSDNTNTLLKKPRLAWQIFLCCALSFSHLPAFAMPLDLFHNGPGGNSRLFVAPSNLFSIQLPSRWHCTTDTDKLDTTPEHLEFVPSSGQSEASLVITHKEVLPGARAKQLMLRALEHRLNKLPHFQENSRKERDLNGVPAAWITGTYWYQGNAQYPRAIEEMFVILSNDAFTLHFECFAEKKNDVLSELDKIYNSFIARPSHNSASRPQTEEDASHSLDNIPF